ncbi:SDR family NAD(P)-dependent oxidoreductase [Galbitalea soli]|uniref:SDR family oxidoreductase n=1 Tax=Galbitalea soli TaxID=1268042 RepID=A0A7C9TSI9_9MICO|nr:SDR family NAD(P)-dependent oxidoreductase [Galbitalea soli]NEM91882.1 SDR family oxidoreductase [Galbitalea soli]NYJ29282.1 NAD(P)-dependent dehydrogenase (short-subunit alcohol dehydrogenase family) [Galbitalea soli]
MTTRTIVVTGATGDAGRATATALLAAGHTVVAIGSDAERLATVLATHRYAADLSDVAATAALAARVRAEVGPVDGLVHLVGGWRAGHDDADWAWLEPRILTTLRSASLAFFDDLAASPAGRLVAVGSVSAAKPTWSGANYAVLKTAADAWMTAAASGFRSGGTAAAVSLMVRSIGPDGTPPETLAAAIVPLWDAPAAELNGAHLTL